MHQASDDTNGSENKTQAIETSPTATDHLHRFTEPSNDEDSKINNLNNNLDSTDQHPRKKLKLTDADKKRNVRMFGALMGTLSKFQDETSKIKQTEAAKRRAAVESRLQTKLRLETEALHQLRAYELEETNLKHQVIRKADKLGHLSELHTIKFANKLAFSHYLRTSITSKIKEAADQNVTTNSTSTYGRSRHLDQPIFWLPYKLLPEQKELIEDQRRAAREEVEESQHIWEEERLERQTELTKLEENRDVRLLEIEEEKARARVKAGSVAPPPTIDDPSTQNPNPNSNLPPPNPVLETHNELNHVKHPHEIRQDTPEVINDIGRDEDAVEY